MAEDWLADVKKYVTNVDEAAVAGIVRYCGIALRTRDASLVSFSDATETDRVRENFLKKKLALTDPDSALDAAIAGVGERMKADRTKNRVTVYYLLAEQFGKLGLFNGGGTATAPTEVPPVPPVEPVAATGAISTAGAAAGAAGLAALGSGAAHASHGGASGHDDHAHGFADLPEQDTSGSIFGKWWFWLLALLLLAALFLMLRSCHQDTVTVIDNSGVANLSGTDLGGDENAGDIDENVTTPVVAPAPDGAGIVAETRNGQPALTVYFDTGKADLAPDFADKAAAVKAYVAAHPDAKLAVSGYNDPTGNAAINAELSKNRAKAVAAALKAEGIPDSAISLEKPADTTITSTDKAAARRVEVTIK